MPTLLPATKRAPRWRMMMLPAVTTSPPNRFTPSRLLTLSRPLRELPCPFLWAILNLRADSQSRPTARLLYNNFFDFQDSVVRADPAFAVVAFAAAKLEGNDLLALFVGFDDLGGHTR